MGCLSFILNLTKRHPICSQLLHCTCSATPDPTVKTLFPDPYHEDLNNPKKTRASDSALWEVAALRRHYHWQVTSLANKMRERTLYTREKAADIDINSVVNTSFT